MTETEQIGKKAARTTVTLRPETYQRLKKLAAACGQSVSDAADEFIADGLDEQDELEERELRIQLGLCPQCGNEKCEGECLKRPASGLALVRPFNKPE